LLLLYPMTEEVIHFQSHQGGLGICYYFVLLKNYVLHKSIHHDQITKFWSLFHCKWHPFLFIVFMLYGLCYVSNISFSVMADPPRWHLAVVDGGRRTEWGCLYWSFLWFTCKLPVISDPTWLRTIWVLVRFLPLTSPEICRLSPFLFSLPSPFRFIKFL
jgi:hypothetical protein